MCVIFRPTSRSLSQASDEILTDDSVETDESKYNKNIEKTSKNLSKLADKLDYAAQKDASSKVTQKPAFRRRVSSNVAKGTSGQSKEKPGAMPVHGQSPYRKSQLAAKPPSGMQKGVSGIKMPVQSKIGRASGIPASKITISSQASQVQETSDGHRNDVTIEMPQKRHRGIILA